MSFFAKGIGWVLTLLFAMLLGSHLFDTAVLVPFWSAKPPESVREWAGTPGKVVAHFRRLLPALLVASLAGLLAAVFQPAPQRFWLFLAALCGIAHMSLIAFFFIPTNRDLGMLPLGGGSSPVNAEVCERLVEAWLRWNRVRLGCDLLGPIAAVQATN